MYEVDIQEHPHTPNCIAPLTSTQRYKTALPTSWLARPKRLLFSLIFLSYIYIYTHIHIYIYIHLIISISISITQRSDAARPISWLAGPKRLLFYLTFLFYIYLYIDR